MMAASVNMITAKIAFKLETSTVVLTGDDKGVDGDPVVLVLLVRVGTPEAEAGQEGTEEVGDEADDDKGSAESDVACKRAS